MRNSDLIDLTMHYVAKTTELKESMIEQGIYNPPQDDLYAVTVDGKYVNANYMESRINYAEWEMLRGFIDDCGDELEKRGFDKKDIQHEYCLTRAYLEFKNCMW